MSMWRLAKEKEITCLRKSSSWPFRKQGKKVENRLT
jgi:hypothetical protein